jgi:formylglycine-generating enzyme required for sulfatase activity
MRRINPQPARGHTEALPQDARTVMLVSADSPQTERASDTDRPLEGTILRGRFKLLQRIGEGGMSCVYRAIDLRRVEAESDDPHVAVKILTVPFANSSDAMKVLTREAHSLRCVTHPNIVRVIDCDRDGDTVFMTLELLSGRSLFDKLQTVKTTGMPRSVVLGVIKGIAEALDFAHARNIVHGDLKPGNVIITDAGETKVIDFGLARLATLPLDGHGTGASNPPIDFSALTPAYASPQMLEKGAPDPRDDVFSLACTTWMLMTGEHPFNGKSLTAARDEGIELLPAGKLTAREFRALQRALEFDRHKRTPSARQFVAEFSGSSRSPSWRMASIGVLALIVLSMAAYFSFRPRGKTLAVVASPAAHVAATPPAPAPGTLFRDCAYCPQMKVLPPGDFVQGSAAADPDTLQSELPRHPVSIARPFAMGVYDATVSEYSEYVAATGYQANGCAIYNGSWRVASTLSWKNAMETQTPLHPVTCVSWQDARQYASWLSHRTGHTYRLPSASEWEYAARAGSTASHPWVDSEAACNYANLADQTAARRYPGWMVEPCSDSYVQSAPVGSFAPNAFGLYDTLGNVFQWVADCWTDDYQGAPSDGTARTDGDCTEREMRGGSWFSRPSYVRVSYRNRFATDYRSTTVGFRLVREMTP